MVQQKALIYAFVARGSVILAEHTDFSGNFNSIAYQCLQKLPASNSKFTYNCDGHTFNYLVDNGFSQLGCAKSGAYAYEHSFCELAYEAGGAFYYIHTYLDFATYQITSYCVVAEESAGRQIPIAYLERIKDDFVSKYGGGKAAVAVANSLNREFGPKLRDHMQYCVDHPEEVLDRGEKIELLVDKTENLHNQAQDFRNTGTQIRRKMWLQNMKIKLIVLGIIIALILIIVLSVCHGFNCGK
nr:vesicle-associated membrane protein 722-like [Ipomoea trifida]GMD05433.1 vesicle-associated membrane protein 721-like [Ipomoea batatas]GMD07389.1 vesicle-associated membrane protein 721-like [Ipomoea batatas]GMD10336.1 vesicle-associated membrane protein 721-like [Ipomoea batatas]